ncbi:MAG: glycosyltransferase [Candidatus Riflebacteria bacterium]|nr:glycosyltransferase [Candidatus Riflebacteria bacterium]
MKPRLLYVSPVIPFPTGNGRKMRSFFQLQFLRRFFHLTLLVVSIDNDDTKIKALQLENCCDSFFYVYGPRFTFLGKKTYNFLMRTTGGAIWRFLSSFFEFSVFEKASPERLVKLLGPVLEASFDFVQVFRFYMTPVAFALRQGGIKCPFFLDMDDFESETRLSIARLYRLNGMIFKSRIMHREAKAYFQAETEMLPFYDKIFTCSEMDGRKLEKRFSSLNLAVLPNTVAIPKKISNNPSQLVCSLFFVGTMDYFPNFDALNYFAEWILPELRKARGIRWKLEIVGMLPRRSWVEKFKKYPEMRFLGYVEDLSAKYSSAHAAIVPIRGGGGTRIKILEAFAHRVPVVSTTIGISGILAQNGVHAFIADDPVEFAGACVNIFLNSSLAKKIAQNAFELVSEKYNADNACSVLAPVNV